MLMATRPSLSPRLAAYALAALSAACAVYWTLAMPGSDRVPASAEVVELKPDVSQSDVSRGLGGVGVASQGAALLPAGQYRLDGLVITGSSGAALISVGGLPARAYRVGSEVSEGLVVRSVAERRAELGPIDPASPGLVLEMPAAQR